MNKRQYWVYILLCSNNGLYTGYTTDLEKRYNEHRKGTAKCKYTRSFKPLKIAQAWRIEGEKSDALKLEAHIKQLSKNKKIQLIKKPETLIDQYPDITILT